MMQPILCLLSNFLSQHVSCIIMPIIRRIRPCYAACGVLAGCVGCGWLWSCGTHDSAPQDHSQPQPTHPVQNTACSKTRSHSTDGGHNDAGNMLRKFDNKHRISCIMLVLCLHLTSVTKSTKQHFHTIKL